MTVKVDLLPSERKRPKLIDGLTIILVILLIPIAAVLYLQGKKYDRQIVDKKKQIELLKQEIAQYTPLKLRLEECKQKTSNINQQVQLLKSLRDNAKNYSVLLEDAKKIIPKNVWIKGMEISGSTIAYNGCSALVGSRDGLATVALFMRNVMDSPTFSNPVISGITRAQLGGYVVYNFTITVNYVLPGGGGAK